jgi:hypothetical protein
MRKSSSLRYFVLAAVISCYCSTGQPATDLDPTDPMIGAALEHFLPSQTSEFRCEDDGARCVFTRRSFASVDFGVGQETENVEGAVWAATDALSAVLTLGDCRADEPTDCIVTCNANCTCTTAAATASISDASSSTPGREECPRVVTRAPTPAPPTPAPVPAVCPEVQNKALCKELMSSEAHLPEGLEFDCYNFCGGRFISSCDFAGSCGTATCDNATDSGVYSIVKGCTDADRATAAAPGDGSSGGDTSSNAAATSTASLAMLVAVVVATVLSVTVSSL